MKTTSSSSIELRILSAAGIVLFALSLFYLGHVYACLTVAFVLAYLLDPLVTRLARLGLARNVAVPLTLIVFFTLLFLLGMAIIPRIFAQGQELLIRLPKVYSSVAAVLGPISERYLGYNVFQDVDKLVGSLGDPGALMTPIGGFVRGIFTGTFKFISTVLGLLIIPLMAYYLLRDFRELYSRVIYYVPKKHHKTVSDIRTRLHGVLGGFIRGQLVVSSILSLYYIVSFSVLRLDLALVLGLMAGFFNIVPYLGITSILVLTLLIAFIHSATAGTFVGIAIVFAVGMAMEGSVLTPRIVGRKVGLSPLTLIIALLVGAELLGLTGMLLAVPLAAIGKVFVDYFIEQYRLSQ